MNQDPFQEYLIQTEPNKRYKGYAWHTAIGLQAVDGLKTSKYLVDTAIQNIEGELSFDEVQKLLDTYYEANPQMDEAVRTEEADKVSVRIAKLLSENAFSFTSTEYISIHKKLFTGIYEYAGKIRDYNITKKEWVLEGETILYGSASELRATLDYDFAQEKNFNYKGLSIEEIIHHLAKFISALWQIHIFPEGNTRTTAVFFIKYLRTLGFQATNDIFAENAWYFRNALVRANYNNLSKGIYETTEFLELFLKNLLCKEQNNLCNRALHVSGVYKDSQIVNIQDAKANIDDAKVNIEDAKANIDDTKVNIQDAKANIDDTKSSDAVLQIYSESMTRFSSKTVNNIQMLFNEFGTYRVFGRSDIQEIIPLRNTRISTLLKELVELQLIEPVSGHGKGKYRFCTKSISQI